MRPVFICGCGRSGTHLIAKTFASSVKVDVTIEVPFVFNRSLRLALGIPKRRDWPQLVDRYRRASALASWPRRAYVDKSHPNLWLAEGLLDKFPGAYFVLVHRRVEGVISSMLKHAGCLRHFRHWRRFPVPNKFLGITREIGREYDDLPVVTKCFLRWKAHADETVRLYKKLPQSNTLLIQYEKFVKDPTPFLHFMFGVCVCSDMYPPPLHPERAVAWKAALSRETRVVINKLKDKYGEPDKSILGSAPSPR